MNRPEQCPACGSELLHPEPVCQDCGAGTGDNPPRTVIDLEHDVGPGWRPLLADLHAELTEAGIQYEALQVKEKWGILRVYISTEGEWHPTFDLTILGQGTITGTVEEGSSTYQRAMAMVHAAEEKSRVICEDCGEPGVLRTDRHWLRTECDACHQNPLRRFAAE